MAFSKDPKYWKTYYTIQSLLLTTDKPSQELNIKAANLAAKIHETYEQV